MKTCRKALITAALMAGAMLLPQLSLAIDQTLILGKGTQVQKLAPGHFRFRLTDGRTVEVRNMNPKSGITGNCGIYDVAGRKIDGSLHCQLKRGMKALGDPDPPLDATGRRPPSPNYVQIDDEITWLPATLIFTGGTSLVPGPASNPAGLSPQPDPPGTIRPGAINPRQRTMLNPQPEPPMPTQLDRGTR